MKRQKKFTGRSFVWNGAEDSDFPRCHITANFNPHTLGITLSSVNDVTAVILRRFMTDHPMDLRVTG